MRSDAILDAVESLIGPEISLTPVHHVHFKLGRRHLALMREVLEAQPPGPALDRNLFEFHMDISHWHDDATYGQPDARQSRIVIAWLPLSESTPATSALQVRPGSHRDPGAREAVALETFPGDLVLFDNHLQHASTPTQSDDRMRWCFNFRYVPTGQPNGRPFLPGFVARSRAHPAGELRDPELWSAMWARALDCVRWYDLPGSAMGRISLAEARANTRRWNERIRDHRDWLALEEPGAWDRVTRQPRALLRRALAQPLGRVGRRFAGG